MQLADELRSGKKRLTNSSVLLSPSLPQGTRSRIISEALPLLTAHIACKSLWAALPMADYKKEDVLNDAAVAVLFNKERSKFTELLQVASSEELHQLLDENEDGFLNEDEQLLMFSLIKERMQASAEELCGIHEYVMYKDMMKAIRVLEADIVNYQEILRKKTHEKQLTAYKRLGQEKLQKFEEDWTRRFSMLEADFKHRLSTLRAKHIEEAAALEAELQGTKSSTSRPKARKRNLIVEERLVAINERFNEAQKIRTELRGLEAEEVAEAAAKRLEDQRKRRMQLVREQEKELRQVELKTQTAENALKIRKEQQFIRLQKEIKLYLNDITKGQNLATRLARKIGETRDELRRTKKKSKEMMQVMSEAKVGSKSRQRARHSESIGTIGSLGSLPLLSTRAATLPGSSSVRLSMQPAYTSNSPLRQTLKEITKFGISSDIPGTEKPVNSGSRMLIKTSSRSKLTAELIGKHTSKSTLKSLGQLYTEELQAKDLEAEEEAEDLGLAPTN